MEQKLDYFNDSSIDYIRKTGMVILNNKEFDMPYQSGCSHLRFIVSEHLIKFFKDILRTFSIKIG